MTRTDETAAREVRDLIWLYFWLLIFEGAIRKWVLPQLAGPLLLVRDPVLIWAYYRAMKAGLFPSNGYIYTVFLLVVASAGASVGAEHGTIGVTLYGLRSDFLHLPLIFLMPRVFSMKDVEKMGYWILALSLPMALLMMAQFKSPADGVLNRGNSGDFLQIASAHGKIRPPGTFSFISGPMAYYPMVAAFLTFGFVERKAYRGWLMLAASVGLLAAAAVSGSRSFIVSIAIVEGALAIACLLRPDFIPGALKLVAIVALIAGALGSTSLYKEGLETLFSRFDQAQQAEEAGGGMVGRSMGLFDVTNLYYDTPFFGYGIGLGTNVGAMLTSGKRQFVLAENEWQRVILESGFLLGACFLLLRIALFLHLAGLCFRSLGEGRLLPLLLLSACGAQIVLGQFGQPTSLGFTVFIGGLCLAACAPREEAGLP